MILIWGREMNTAGVSGAPVTQDLIQDPSLRVRSLRNKTGIQKNALKSDESAFETMPAITSLTLAFAGLKLRRLTSIDEIHRNLHKQFTR